MSEKALIFGHKNPDTDSICSVLAYEALKKQLGENVEARRLGNLNKETEFVLNYFDVEAPKLLATVDPNAEGAENTERQKVILIDHNERIQSVDGLETAQITEVIDHHKFGEFSTFEPLMIRAEPVGCSSTILLTIYKENDLLPEKKMAGMMLSAIISDTLLFKSPTCTPRDVKAAEELAKIAGVDLEKYGMDMLIAGASFGDKSTKEIINMDMKEFEMGANKIAIAQVNTVNVAEILDQKEQYESTIQEQIESEGYDLFVFIITDILRSGSETIVLGKATDVFESAFDTKLDNNTAWLEGAVSRKKQFVPNLMEVSK
ncbi:manganese-dependent inorganic pyrophosphatase [Aureibacter tunicatorum]|uniref:inorganic diphosphatase n=1 Tax=Aureibacter tunicatorum TaxID=866807 RepID=A0AAE3XLS2_9BACT|nr:manganese-dependent inorganic pyrophosphatase [Aureibacter tunicatorum]MDR6240261.1 manganese-dependent inorganic pyrophosphatase [Aureibacter tunicatorum]BDD05858.1 putative manganese-dependent inorganic pyrophosphatase [Aureibacter tunicatorum]